MKFLACVSLLIVSFVELLGRGIGINYDEKYFKTTSTAIVNQRFINFSTNYKH